MARNYSAATDRVSWGTYPYTNGMTSETVAFWMKSTDTTTNMFVWGNWSSVSREGLGLILNNVANKIRAVGYDATTLRAGPTSTTSVNTGSWFHVAATMDRQNGGRCDIYVNGVSEANENALAAWTTTGSQYTLTGDAFGTFWPTFIGDLAEVGHWADVKLNADEIAALAKGIKPYRIRTHALDLYAPLVRDRTNYVSPTDPNLTDGPATTGTAISDHPRMFG